MCTSRVLTGFDFLVACLGPRCPSGAMSVEQPDTSVESEVVLSR
jgi:hypothetical protein